jgi:uncharacterized protein YukJ
MSKKRVRAAATNSYGVLVGKIKDGQIDPPADKTPHYEIWVVAGNNYRIAVNVRSDDESEVLAYFDSNFTLPTKLNLPQLAAGAPGFHALATGPTGKGLDYLRDNLFPLSAMTTIPAEGSGVTLANLLDAQIKRAKADPEAVVIAFGDSFTDSTKDPIFGFTPDRGIHDIHMMQGNPADGSFANDNRINGDGALFIRFTGGETIALFVRFATQSTTTGNNGNPS